MTANKKLQGDIERALKDVAKGVEVFDDIYKKILDADTSTKKEKGEIELKTQIKKLQRTRDQIKTWLSSEDIREKEPLANARRIIESRMETFKKIEKEAKTKAFSKEGLAQADKLDPEEEKRQECREWVNDVLEQIREQKDAVGAELEVLQQKKGKKHKEELDEIQERLKQHTWHVTNLELVLRGLDNDVLNYGEVDALKDDVEYYVNSNKEADFVNDETLYEPLDLESKLGVLGKEVVGEVATAPPLAVEDAAAKEKQAKLKRKQELDNAEALANAEALERKNKQEQLLKEQQNRQRLISEREEAARKRREQLLQRESSNEEPAPLPSSPQVTPLSPPQRSAASVVASSMNLEATEPLTMAPPSSVAAIVAGSLGRSTSQGSVNTYPPLPNERQKSDTASSTGTLLPPPIPASSSNNSAPKDFSLPVSIPSSVVPLAHPHPLDYNEKLLLFDASLSFIPTAVDAERSKMHIPHNPFTGAPSQFPGAPHSRFEDPRAFEKLELDALFFIFFHQPGTYQQCLAARELKRHDWRFHKQYQFWMQRVEDPTSVTTEHEVGTIVYFDQNVWSQRVKSNFTLEYRFLEN